MGDGDNEVGVGVVARQEVCTLEGAVSNCERVRQRRYHHCSANCLALENNVSQIVVRTKSHVNEGLVTIGVNSVDKVALHREDDAVAYTHAFNRSKGELGQLGDNVVAAIHNIELVRAV